MAQLITVRLNKSEHQPLGFRLQGGKDFGTPLVVQKVNGGSAAERSGLQAGDALIKVNSTDVYTLRHQEAQDAIRAAGTNLELIVQRGGGTWRPSVTPTGSLPRPGSRPLGPSPALVTNTSLKATPQPSRAFGSGHNNIAKPFGYMNGNDSVKGIVNKQYNTPVNMYSDKTIAETLSAQTEVLAGGVLGVNFKKNEKSYDAEKSAVFKVLQEEQNDPEPVEVGTPISASAPPPVSGLRPVQAPVTRPDAPINNTGGLPPGQNICEECERLITGVFVRIKDKNLHVECFKCSTCGTSLKNQGYYNLNGKLYCDIHAKLVARQNPPAPNLDPVTVPPGSRIPSNTYSTPLPPLATNNYSNGSSSMFSPSSNISGPKPFGSSIGSAYSPSLSPRSAPMSPARPVVAPAPISVPAPAPAPIIAPPSAAPYAPKAPVSLFKAQNLKSVVWPPAPISSDDETPKYDTNQKLVGSNSNQPTQMANNITFDSTVKTANMQKESSKQIVTSSTQMEEYGSTVSYASAAISTVSASLLSESVVQSNQSNLLQESSTRTVQSFSQESSATQSFSSYQGQSNPPILLEKRTNDPGTTKETQICESKESKQAAFSSEVKTVNVAANPINPNIQSGYVSKENSSIEENIAASFENKHESKMTQQLQNNKPTPGEKQLTQDQKTGTIYSSEQKITNPNNQSNLNTEYSRMESMPTNVTHLSGENVTHSMVEALTIAPDRPYSPLPTTPQPTTTFGQINSQEETSNVDSKQQAIKERPQEQTLPAQPSPIFTQEPKRGVTPIPPIETYNPPENIPPPMPMPEETKPYIPPDFKIIVEPKLPREATSSPMVDALTTIPDRPFTPITQCNNSIQRGSLRDALTIAPDRPFSPFYANNQSNQYTKSSTTNVQLGTSDILKPIATQSLTQMSEQSKTEFSTIQSTCQLQSSSETSAFKPIAKQVYPPPRAEFPTSSNYLPSAYVTSTSTHQETSLSESMTMQQTSFSNNIVSDHGYSSVKNAQNFFEQLDKKESLSSTAVRCVSGLHKPDSIPPYQRNFEQLPSQRGITPELYNAPAVLQRPVTPGTGTPMKAKEKSLEPKSTPVVSEAPAYKIPQIKTPVPTQMSFHKDTPITMTFQPVSDEHLMRNSPMRSRPVTPSLINKPAPIIPHYQMNLVSVEYIAPESHLYDPSSREPSRSPTPNPRSRSPAPGPPPNPLKAQAPRIRDYASQQYREDEFGTQGCRTAKQGITDTYGATTTSWAQNIAPVFEEQRHSQTAYKSENYSTGDMNYREDALMHENYGQRHMQSQNIVEQGNTTVHTTRKTFEEFERTQSAKVIEIQRGAASSGSFQQLQPTSRVSDTNTKQIFPPPIVSLPPNQQISTVNLTNENATIASRRVENYAPKPTISGANPGPVCDPTPSTGPSVGAAARGKTFGVSSAPKRGRGVLNKAALPGSRVPLCASCNGNIRGPFITALGRIWCPEHFICVNATCRRPLQDIGFVEENGQLYCEYCFEQYIAPACDKCHAKIKGDCLNAIGKHYHPECFNCVYCGKLFGNNPFFLEDGLPYCEADWNELFTTKCFACGFPVEAGDRWVEALNNNYHSQCFNCTVCKKNLEGQSFFAKGGRPFCKTHAR